MFKNHALLIFSLALLAVGCGNTEPQQANEPAAVPFAEALLGTWETIEIETHSPTYEGKDTTAHLLVKEADWGRLYGSKPARTEYTADGKLKRTYFNILGETVDVTNGLWKTMGEDSLFIIEPNTTLSYKHELEGSRLTLTGKVDWDSDGEEDDDYRAVLRLVSKTN
jgi:hypothetical protein